MFTVVFCFCSPPARLAYFATGLSAFALFSCYSAVLTSLMTAGGEEVRIRSFGDVLTNGYQVCFAKLFFSLTIKIIWYA